VNSNNRVNMGSWYWIYSLMTWVRSWFISTTLISVVERSYCLHFSNCKTSRFSRYRF